MPPAKQKGRPPQTQTQPNSRRPPAYSAGEAVGGNLGARLVVIVEHESMLLPLRLGVENLAIIVPVCAPRKLRIPRMSA